MLCTLNVGNTVSAFCIGSPKLSGFETGAGGHRSRNCPDHSEHIGGHPLGEVSFVGEVTPRGWPRKDIPNGESVRQAASA